MEITLVGGESQTLTIDVKVDGVSGGEYTITTEDTDKLTIDGDTITANVDVEDGSANVVITSVLDEAVSVTIPVTLQVPFFRWIEKNKIETVTGYSALTQTYESNIEHLQIESNDSFLQVMPLEASGNSIKFALINRYGGGSRTYTVNIKNGVDNVTHGTITAYGVSGYTFDNSNVYTP